jgi:hypothetical protein
VANKSKAAPVAGFFHSTRRWSSERLLFEWNVNHLCKHIRGQTKSAAVPRTYLMPRFLCQMTSE